MPRPADRAAQDKEAEDRRQRGEGNPHEHEDPAVRSEAADAARAMDDDSVEVDHDTNERGQDHVDQDEREEERRQPRIGSHHDDARSRIAGNFRQNRNSHTNEAAENAAEIARLTHEGLPPELVASDTEDLEEEQDQQQQDEQSEQQQDEQQETQQQQEQPRRTKVKVRGEERFLSEEELIAAAQIGLAGESYLNEAKSKLDEVNGLLRQTEDRVRSTPAGTHPAGETASTDGQNGTQDDAQHQGNIEEFVQTLQFGQPEDVTKVLREFVRREAAPVSAEVSTQEKRVAEVRRSQAAMKAFEEQNPDLASDRLAVGAITSRIREEQEADLRAAGFDPAKFKGTPDQVASQIADVHMILRTDGHQAVRSFDRILNDAKTSFDAWRGVKPAPTTDEDPSRSEQQQHQQQQAQREPAQRQQGGQQQQQSRQQGAKKVVVNVDRSERRAQIPQQPTRTALPRRPAQAPQQQPRSRSEVVAQMRSHRDKLAGRTR